MGWIDHTGDENGDFHHLGVAFVASEAAEVPSLVVSAAHPPPPHPSPHTAPQSWQQSDSESKCLLVF